MGGYLNYMNVSVCGNCLAKIYFILPSIDQLTMPNFFSVICLQWYQQKNTAYRIQLSACLKSYIKAGTGITDFGVSTAIRGEL